ncbi:hypothetical protein BUALT_Bualt07G0058900 [Buddleja alternifolia]|uniref:Uncharacterized protein n=1 Tax=Buddleja alternifolia TaxID=168488 RepID=A0AAV6XF89_9LAMI|nr:hypothetical protein BUALT_Bualt07G0058900 [Buddleja alternifolia]
MDCSEPVDDYCEAWQADNLKVPEKIPSTDHFFIAFQIERTYPLIMDINHEEEAEEEFVRVEGTDILAFWEPCPRIEHENLPRGKISSMLSKAGVPLHKQEFMVDRISGRADEIANADYNKDKKVLPMIVSISVVACFCYDTAVC